MKIKEIATKAGSQNRLKGVLSGASNSKALQNVTKNDTPSKASLRSDQDDVENQDKRPRSSYKAVKPKPPEKPV